jgi:hypothetical protein
MRVNTAKSIALGERVYKEFGNWAKARQTAILRNGVYVLRSKASDDQSAPQAEGQAKRKA